MKSLFIVLALCFSTIAFSQSDSTSADAITYGKRSNGWYYVNLGKHKVDFATDLGVFKKKVLYFVRDFPELHLHANYHMHRDMAYVSSIFSCYNSYKAAVEKPTIDANYFREFGLFTKKESRKGPTDELLSVKQPISFTIRSLTVTTIYDDGREIRSQKFRSRFTYGMNPGYYKTGFLLRNMKKVMRDDEEAMRHIRSYRASNIARTTLVLSGWTAFFYGGYQIDQGTGRFPVVMAILGCVVANIPLAVPAQSKAKNIIDATEAYNSNL
jgi:hypothetical protein